MLPILPFRLLVPLALGTSALVFLLIAVLVTRRLLLLRSKGGARAVAAARALSWDAMSDAARQERAIRWITARPARIHAFVAAARELERAHPEWRDWLVRSDIPKALARIG